MSTLHPPPAYAVNAPISELQTAELLIVASLQLWAAMRSTYDGCYPDWRGGLVAAGLEGDQIRAFDAHLAMITAAHLRRPDVRPPTAHISAWTKACCSSASACCSTTGSMMPNRC